MKIECTRYSRWGNPKDGGPQTFKQGQILVVGEDVKEFRASEMLRCGYAKKVDAPIVEETKKVATSETTQEKAGGVKAGEIKVDKPADKPKKKGANK